MIYQFMVWDNPNWNKPFITYPIEGISTVDMPLSWINIKKPIQLLKDLYNGLISANTRWGKAVRSAAPDIAKAVDSGTYAIVEVPGVNSHGLDADKLKKVQSKLKIPEGCTLVICHSAGTDAAARSMALTRRDKSDIYYLVLSPRMKPSMFAEHMQAGNVDPSHVLTVNSKYDFPHWADNIKLVRKEDMLNLSTYTLFPIVLGKNIFNNFSSHWNDYAYCPLSGSHAFLVKDLSGDKSNLGHGSMYDGMWNDKEYNVIVNGTVRKEKITISELVNLFIRNRLEDR